MLKDRKFWSGFLAGAMIIGGMLFVQPMNAADQSGAEMKNMMKIMLQMAKTQRQMGIELTAIKDNSNSIKTNTDSMSKNLAQLNKNTQAGFSQK